MIFLHLYVQCEEESAAKKYGFGKWKVTIKFLLEGAVGIVLEKGEFDKKGLEKKWSRGL